MEEIYESFKDFVGNYDLVPMKKELYADSLTPMNILRRLTAVSKEHFLLESVEGGEQIGRYSFLGYDPLLHVYTDRTKVVIEEGAKKRTLHGDPIMELKKLLRTYRSPQMKDYPTFTGGFVGYFAYDFYQMVEPELQMKQSEFPVYDLYLYDKVIAFDHIRQKVILITNVKMKDGEQGYQKAKEELEQMTHLVQDNSPLPPSVVTTVPDFKCNVSKETYCDMVERTKHYIYEGDIFQAVISRRFEAEYNDSLLNAYRVMRTINPSPYMYYIQADDVQIAGVSPETLVKNIDGKVTTFPVAGTRPRGTTNEEDLALEQELRKDEKELAEHNMLVDLARNDMARISTYGSVKVESYMKIHRFSKVMHIASTVTGTLKDSKDSIDVVAAILPAGTLSGAPKIRACEIIDEIETVPRGVYGGAIGYLDLSGNLDVCIAIRTAVKKQNKVYVQAGGGIVADSVPEREYEESANKAGAILEAIRRANEVNEA